MTKKRVLPEPARVYKEAITYECPVRGTVTQIVVVKRYKYRGTPEPLVGAWGVSESKFRPSLDDEDIDENIDVSLLD